MSGQANGRGTGPLLSIDDLNITFRSSESENHAVKNASLHLERGETVALVGESGSGKSVTALSVLQLLPGSASVTGSVKYQGKELIGADERTMRDVRGDDISMIFQEPMTALNPLHVVEKQISESLTLHRGIRGAEARKRTIELLTKVGIREAETRLKSYPHQLC